MLDIDPARVGARRDFSGKRLDCLRSQLLKDCVDRRENFPPEKTRYMREHGSGELSFRRLCCLRQPSRQNAFP
jgi:hypothetical protein